MSDDKFYMISGNRVEQMETRIAELEGALREVLLEKALREVLCVVSYLPEGDCGCRRCVDMGRAREVLNG